RRARFRAALLELLPVDGGVEQADELLGLDALVAHPLEEVLLWVAGDAEGERGEPLARMPERVAALTAAAPSDADEDARALDEAEVAGARGDARCALTSAHRQAWRDRVVAALLAMTRGVRWRVFGQVAAARRDRVVAALIAMTGCARDGTRPLRPSR